MLAGLVLAAAGYVMCKLCLLELYHLFMKAKLTEASDLNSERARPVWRYLPRSYGYVDLMNVRTVNLAPS